jgi:hypothetical protein
VRVSGAAGAALHPASPFLGVAGRSTACLALAAFVFVAFRLGNGASVPFLAFSLAGSFVVLMTAPVTAAELVGLLCLAPLIEELYRVSGGAARVFPASCVATGTAFVGLASVLLLLRRAIFRAESVRPFLLAVVIPAAMLLTRVLVVWAISWQPLVYDYHAYRFDLALRLPLIRLAASAVGASRPLMLASVVVYNALPLVLILACLHQRARKAGGASLLWAFGAVAAGGYLLYLLLPVTGPRYVFGAGELRHLPLSVPLVLTAPLQAAPRNGVPSLHLTSALLVFWSFRGAGRCLRLAAAAFLALTALATVAFGEHYFVDLLVAIPFAVSVQCGYQRQWRRAACALLATLVWMLYLRWGIPRLEPAPAVAWALAALSLASSALVARRRAYPAASRFILRATRKPSSSACS